MSTRTCCAVLSATFALLALNPAHGDNRPSYGLRPGGVLVLTSLPEVITRKEVQEHLTSGLTTTFAFSVTARGEAGKQRGATRIDMRWELWDEVFLTDRLGADGVVRSHSVASLEELAHWWRRLELPVMTGISADDRPEVTVELVVLPFSHSEELDARRWLSESLAPGRLDSATESGRQPGAGDEARSSAVVDLLLATSIQRRSVARFVWTAAPEPPSTPR